MLEFANCLCGELRNLAYFRQPTMAEGREETDLISDLLLNPFSRRTHEEKLEIVKKGRATPRLASLSRAGKGFVRHFHSMNYLFQSKHSER